MGTGPEAAHSRRSTAVRPLRLVFNPETLSLDERTIVVQRANDGGYICLGLGSAGQFLRAVGESAVREKTASNPDEGDPFLRRLKTAIALAKDYDPAQPRDDHGRWTSDGVSAAAAGTTAAMADAARMFGDTANLSTLRALAARALAGAAAVVGTPAAATVGGAAAFFGTLFMPTNRSTVSEGTLPDAPDYSYQFDQEAGHLTITHQFDDGTSETVFSGRYDKDGVFRDEDGNPIGRFLGNSVALDADAVNGYEARRKSDAQSQASANTQTAVTARSDPKACPDPGPDKSGYKSPGALAYQMYVGMQVNGEPLPPGIGIKMTRSNGRPVYFDDCQQSTGALIEAKGFGYSDAMNSGKLFPWLGMYINMMDQSKRQLEAARGRPIEWYFAEKDVADYMRKVFAKQRPGISVFYLRPPRGLIGQLRRIIEGIMV